MHARGYPYRTAVLGGGVAAAIRTIQNDVDSLLYYAMQDSTDNGVAVAYNKGVGMPDGTELLTDTTASAWTQINNANITDQADNVLRVARDGTNNPRARQFPLTIGEVYQFAAQARSDGNASPQLLIGSTNTWLGSTATSWQSVNVVFVAGATNADLQSITSTGTEYTEWRNLSIEKVTTGRNLVQNPFFDTDTIWIKGSGWAIAGGKATKTPGVQSLLQQTIAFDFEDIETEMIFKVSGITAGSVLPFVTGAGTGVGTARTADGIYTERLVGSATTPTVIYLRGDAAFDGSIEFVIVRPVSSATNGRYGRNIALNNFFANWTGDDPDDWAVTEVGDATSNITENPAGHCQIISDGTLASIIQGVLGVGKSYVCTVHISTVGSGYVQMGVSGGTKITANTVGVHTWVINTAETANFIVAKFGACDVTIDYARVEQILIEPSANYPKADVIVNGGFDADSDWTKGDAAITIGSGVATWSGAQAGNADLTAAVAPLTNGLRYLLTYTVSNYSAGTITPLFGTQTGTGRTGNGSYSEEVVGNGTAFVMRGDATFAGNIDNVQVKPTNPLNIDLTAVSIGQPSGNPRVGVMMGGNGTSSKALPGLAEMNSIIPIQKGSVRITALCNTWAAGVDYLLNFSADANNGIYIYRTGSDLVVGYNAGGTAEEVTIPSGSPAGPFIVGLDWDTDGSGAVRAFYNGVQSGSTQTIAGVLVGNLAATLANYFANASTPTNVLDGDAAHAVWTDNTRTAAQWLADAQLQGLA